MASKRPEGCRAAKHFAGRGRRRGARHIMRLKEPVGAFDLRGRAAEMCACARDVQRLSAVIWMWLNLDYRTEPHIKVRNPMHRDVGNIILLIGFIENSLTLIERRIYDWSK